MFQPATNYFIAKIFRAPFPSAAYFNAHNRIREILLLLILALFGLMGYQYSDVISYYIIGFTFMLYSVVAIFLGYNISFPLSISQPMLETFAATVIVQFLMIHLKYSFELNSWIFMVLLWVALPFYAIFLFGLNMGGG